MKTRQLLTTQALIALLSGDALCPRCNGRGRTDQHWCVTCDGVGTTVEYYHRPHLTYTQATKGDWQ